MGERLKITVAGGGLAGSEAAWQLAERGFIVDLMEMRPFSNTPAHKTDKFAELVCSNSLKAQDKFSASGLLKEELMRCGSLLIKTAYECRVPAGGALAVDRALFSEKITSLLSGHKNINIIRKELTAIPDGPAVIATGPLTSGVLAAELKSFCGGALYFADAISPIIAGESIDKTKGYFLGRYGKGGDDYFNIPMSKDEYDFFYDAIAAADKTVFHDFEDIAYFEGCMPVEIMAERGRETLAFGPMKPVGLEDPATGKRPYAVMQLRKENAEGSAFNIVGFQTKMTVDSQKKVFRIPQALKEAEFLRFGAVHRNTYIEGPSNLDKYFRLKKSPAVFMAGQITGLEGYVESIAGGFIAAVQMSRAAAGKDLIEFPAVTALGCLSLYISGGSGLAHACCGDYSPSNFHFGMLPPLREKIRDKKLKKEALSLRALETLDKIVGNL